MKHLFSIFALLCLKISLSQPGFDINLDSLLHLNNVKRVHSATWNITDSSKIFSDTLPNMVVMGNNGRIYSEFYGIGMLIYKTRSYSNDKLVREYCFASIAKGSRDIYSDSLPCYDTTEYKDTFYVKDYTYNQNGRIISVEQNGLATHEIVEYLYNDKGKLDRVYLTTIEHKDTTTQLWQLYHYDSNNKVDYIEIFNGDEKQPSEIWTYKWKKDKVKSIIITYPEKEDYRLYIFNKQGLLEKEIYIGTEPHWGGESRTIVTYKRDENGLILQRVHNKLHGMNTGTSIQYFYYE